MKLGFNFNFSVPVHEGCRSMAMSVYTDCISLHTDCIIGHSYMPGLFNRLWLWISC